MEPTLESDDDDESFVDTVLKVFSLSPRKREVIAMKALFKRHVSYPKSSLVAHPSYAYSHNCQCNYYTKGNSS